MHKGFENHPHVHPLSCRVLGVYLDHVVSFTERTKSRVDTPRNIATTTTYVTSKLAVALLWSTYTFVAFFVYSCLPLRVSTSGSDATLAAFSSIPCLKCDGATVTVAVIEVALEFFSGTWLMNPFNLMAVLYLAKDLV